MTFLYTTHGLTLRVPFPCPALPPAPPGGEPDVVVEYGEVPRRLPKPAAADAWWDAERGRFLLRAGMRTGRFLVENGERVTIERAPEGEDERLAAHLLDSVLAAVLHQRGLVVLHANAALTAKGAVAVAGDSGAGKSTTLAAIVARGCAMLADDVVALARGADGRIVVLPGIPQLHLWQDAAERLGRDPALLPRSPLRRGKVVVSFADATSAEPAALRALYVLSVRAGGMRVRRLGGGEKFAALNECIYGPLLAEEHPGCFPLLAAAAAQADVYRVERSTEGWTADLVAQAIIEP